MMRALVFLCLVFVLTAADPVTRTSSSLKDSGYDVKEVVNERMTSVLKEPRLIPDTTALAINVITALIGYKVSALSLAVSVIKFLVSNILFVVIGSLVAVGLCKVTDKCSLKYEELIPVTQLRSIVTPERLETAENFLVKAVKRYAEEEKIFSSTDY